MSAATPHAYLEKIFQISMRVPRMESEAYGRLIDGLAGTHLARPERELSIDESARKDSEREEPVAADASVRKSTNLDADIGEFAARGPAPGPELTGEALRLELREVEYLKRLGDLVPTPRAAKRLVNVYRLIRVQLTRAERARFVRAHDGMFHAVMLFLALNARFPSQALELFDRIIEGRPAAKNWPDLRAQLERESGNERDWKEMWAAIPSATPAGMDSLTLPITSMRWPQLRNAAILAMRYSLPGLRANEGYAGGDS